MRAITNSRPLCSRRSALRAITAGGSAALLAACTSEAPTFPTAVTVPAPSTQVPTPVPTASPTLTPSPTPTPTPDIGEALRRAAGWFEVEELIGMQGDLLVARVGGQPRVIAVLEDAGWLLNVPGVDPAGSAYHSADEITGAQRALAAEGYGSDLLLRFDGPGLEGIAGQPASGGALISDAWGALYELPRPDSGQPEVRWRGRAWVAGLSDGAEWRPALDLWLDGTQPALRGFVLLTADDCRTDEDTAMMLDLLDEAGLPATFFPNTPNVTLLPDLFARMAEAGHEIGYHTTKHSHGDWEPGYLASDLAYFDSVVRDVTGCSYFHTRCVRPPFGLWDYGRWMDWAHSAGLVTAMWQRSAGHDAWPSVIRRDLDEQGQLLLLMHPRPYDDAWLRRHLNLLEELAASYTFETVSGALIRAHEAHRVELAGLPVL